MSQKGWVLLAVGCGTFMATLDSSIVNIGLPTLTKELGTELGHTKWVVIGYLLTLTCSLLPFGRLSDTHGRKRMFQSGFAVFGIGSILCGISPNLLSLALWRALQGFGASMLMANGPALITASYPVRERGKALGTLGMIVSAGLISGPSIGGFLISHLGWRSIFWVNVPVAIAGFFTVLRSVPSDPPPSRRAPFDWQGAILQTIVLLSVLLVFDPPGFSLAPDASTFSRLTLVGVLLVFGTLLVRTEARVEAPVLDLSLLNDRTFWSANLASLLTFISYSTISVLMPFFLEDVLGFSPDRAGIFMSAVPLTIFIVAPISGRLSDQLGSRGLSMSGASVGALALFVMSGVAGPGIHPTTSHAVIVLLLCSMGLATGLFQSPNNNAIMSSVPLSKLGVASATIATIRNLGLAVGTGLATTFFDWRLRATGDFVSAIHATHFLGGVIAVGAVLASSFKRKGPIR